MSENSGHDHRQHISIYFASEEITKAIYQKLDHIHEHIMRQGQAMNEIADRLAMISTKVDETNGESIQALIRKINAMTRQVIKIVP